MIENAKLFNMVVNDVAYFREKEGGKKESK